MTSAHSEELYERKAELCRTFADPRRLMILEELRQGERAVGDLARRIGVRQATASRHLSVLRERGAVRSRREGTSVYYSLTDERIGQACQLVHAILLAQIERDRELAEQVIQA